MTARLVFLAALPGLAWAQKVNVEFDQDTDFSRFKTFSIGEGRLNSKNPNLNGELVRKKIESEIRKRLTEKGLSEVSQGQNLNVRFQLGSAPRKEVDVVYPRRWYGGRRIVTTTTEGTLVIDLRDTSQRSLVWRAIAQEEGSPPHINDKLDDMVKKAFEKYPPKK